MRHSTGLGEWIGGRPVHIDYLRRQVGISDWQLQSGSLAALSSVRNYLLILATKHRVYVLVHDRVIEKMVAWLDPPQGINEAGGIFVGSYRGPHVEILDCTTPLPSGTTKRTLFGCRDPGLQSAALTAWNRSEGTETFVGEWHTHPEHIPRYCGMDRRTWDGGPDAEGAGSARFQDRRVEQMVVVGGIARIAIGASQGGRRGYERQCQN